VPQISIVGAGLSGMVTALRLRERGCDVTLYEASSRLGGKAGADSNSGRYEEHGYHIFPAWYMNVWRLVDQLGIRDHFIDCHDFAQLRPGQFPHFRTLHDFTSARYFLRNLFSGVLSVPEMYLFFYSVLDLASQPYRYRALLDQISLTGFFRSRFYRTETVADELQDLMLKGISVPSYIVSAMTTRAVMRFWMKNPLPMFRILRGNLQEFWIWPLQRELERLGCDIRTGYCLTRLRINHRRVSSLEFDVGGTQREIDATKVVLAIPVEKLQQLLDDEVYGIAPGLSAVQHLRAEPMAALNLYLRSKLSSIPKAHVNLLDSRFGLSFIDVSQIWTGYGNTVLNVIASDMISLRGLSEDQAAEALIEDLGRYLPNIKSEIAECVFKPHIEQPLFMNDVGAWQFRPKARTEIANLYLAGDFCQSHIDLVSMEGAVTCGLEAAEALRSDLEVGNPIEILKPSEYARFLLLLAKLLLIPFAAIAKLATLVFHSR